MVAAFHMMIKHTVGFCVSNACFYVVFIYRALTLLAGW